jgi:hypothetical protein
MAPVMRRHSSNEHTMKYDEYKPLIVKETRSLNAVGEPMLIKPIRMLIAVVTYTALIGVSARGCTYVKSVTL